MAIFYHRVRRSRGMCADTKDVLFFCSLFFHSTHSLATRYLTRKARKENKDRRRKILIGDDFSHRHFISFPRRVCGLVEAMLDGDFFYYLKTMFLLFIDFPAAHQALGDLWKYFLSQIFIKLNHRAAEFWCLIWKHKQRGISWLSEQ